MAQRCLCHRTEIQADEVTMTGMSQVLQRNWCLLWVYLVKKRALCMTTGIAFVKAKKLG